jgi:hypothetical protein
LNFRNALAVLPLSLKGYSQFLTEKEGFVRKRHPVLAAAEEDLVAKESQPLEVSYSSNLDLHHRLIGLAYL